MKINYDVDGERSLLGACILSQDKLFEACQTLEPQMFFDPHHMELFYHIQELYKEGSEVDLKSLMSRLKIKGKLDPYKETLSMLKSSAAGGQFRVHLQNILVNYKKTRISDILKSLSEDYEENHIFEIQEVCNSYFNGNTQVKTSSLKQISQETFFQDQCFEDFITRRHEDYKRGKKISGYSTGFHELDNKINGLNIGHYLIIAGQPGSGKTTFALQIMKNLTESGIKCGFLSLEMLKEQAFIKLLSMDTGIPFNQILKGQFTDNQKYEILAMSNKLMENPNLFIQDANVDNLMSLRSRVKHLVEVKGVQVLFVDYITCIKNNVRGGSSVEQIQQISAEIRVLLNELRIAGVIISQLNRASNDTGKPPEKHHLYGSGQLEKDAHEILMLHPDEFTRDRTLYIRKNRFGYENERIKYNFKNGVFEEVFFGGIPMDQP